MPADRYTIRNGFKDGDSKNSRTDCESDYGDERKIQRCEKNIDGNFQVSGNIESHKDLIVLGDAKIRESLLVRGKALIRDSLKVEDCLVVEGCYPTKLGGSLDVHGETQLHNKLEVCGDTKLEGSLQVQECAKFDKKAVISGPTELESTLWVSGATKLINSLQVCGATEMKGSLQVCGDVKLNDQLQVCGDVNVAGPLNVSDGVTVEGALTVEGATTLNTLNMNYTKITNLANPTKDNDAVNKRYADFFTLYYNESQPFLGDGSKFTYDPVAGTITINSSPLTELFLLIQFDGGASPIVSFIDINILATGQTFTLDTDTELILLCPLRGVLSSSWPFSA